MEARASRRTRGLLVVLVLFLLKPTANGFAGSPVVTETYLSGSSQDSDQSADLTASSRAVISEGTARFGYSSTSDISELSSTFLQRESHTATDQSSVTAVTESWTTQNRLDISTELLESSPVLSLNPVSDWEDPSIIANITNGYSVVEEWQPALMVRTVRDLTLTKVAEQDHIYKDTRESGLSTYKQKRTDWDTTESASSTFKQQHMDQDNTASASNTFKQQHMDQDNTASGSNTFKQQHVDLDTTASGSNTFKQQHVDLDTTAFGSNTFKQQHVDLDTTASGSNTFKQQHVDLDTTASGSNTFKQQHVDLDTTASASNTFKQQHVDLDTTKSGSNTFKQQHVDLDTTESGSNSFKQQHMDQDSTESGSNTFKQQHVDLDTTASASNTFKQQHVDLDTTESGSNTFKQQHVDLDTTESGSNTFKQQHVDLNTTESGSNTFKHQHVDLDTTESASNTFKQQHMDQDNTASGSNTFKQQHVDQDTTASGSNNFKQQHVNLDTTASGSNTFKQQHVDLDTTASASNTFKQQHVDLDTTESGSNTFKQQHVGLDTTESGSNTFKQQHVDLDTTVSASNTFKQQHVDLYTTESGSNTFKQQHVDLNSTESGSNTFKQQHVDLDTTESASNTFKQQHMDQDNTASGSNTFKQQHMDQDTTASGSNTFKQQHVDLDTTASGSNTFKQQHVDLDTTASASNTFKQQHVDLDTTKSGSNTFKQQHVDLDTTESGSNTFKQQHVDLDTTASASNTFKQQHVDLDTSASGSNTFKHQHVDLDTTESGSNTFKQQHMDPDTTASGSNTFKQQHMDQDTTDSVSNTSKQEDTGQDTTDFGINTDSTYISTTLSRAGERTLLSITFNSTTPYVEDTSYGSSKPAPHAVTGEVGKTKGTQHMEYTEDTKSGHSEAIPAEVPTNATQRDVFDIGVFHGSRNTQSHMGQPTATGSDFEPISKTSNPSSTPPLTLINSTDSEIDTTDSSSTNQNFSTVTDSSSPSTFIPPISTHTNVSHQDDEVTETVDTLSTNTGRKIDEPTFMEETTISSLTTTTSTLWDMTTSVYKSHSTQQNSVFQTDSSPDPTRVLSTATEPFTNKPPLIEKNTHKALTAPVLSTTLESTGTTAEITTHQYQASTIDEVYTMPHTTLSATETPKKTTANTQQHHPTTGTTTSSLSASSSQYRAGATYVSTLHFETSTATPGSTTAHSQYTTASYNKVTPTNSTAVIATTGKHIEAEATTTQMLVKLSLTPGHMCPSHICANGGKCVFLGGYRCECLPAWRGENCTEDVDECVSSPCPQDSVCVNTRGSFSCDCALGYDLQDGRSCTQTRTFLGIFSMNTSLHDSHREILQLLNASLSNLHGYRRSILRHLDGLHILAVNMFSMSANVTSIDIFGRIQVSLRNCNKQQSHCSINHQPQLSYQMESLCSAQKNRCDTQYAECSDSDGTPYCQCHEGYFKKNPVDSTCRDCGDGFKLVNGTCMECPFGFGGFNCNNFYGLIAKIVSPAAGGLLLIVIIALIITCCRKDKNDINKIIFKSGDLQMAPYGDFPKSSRVSMEWGRETIEMQENGSTKNLLQMTDIYYSAALRNADLDRNGLYHFSGLPGSRHSCIYPAQWNPSFISDDSRRRDYF